MRPALPRVRWKRLLDRQQNSSARLCCQHISHVLMAALKQRLENAVDIQRYPLWVTRHREGREKVAAQQPMVAFAVVVGGCAMGVVLTQPLQQLHRLGALRVFANGPGETVALKECPQSYQAVLVRPVADSIVRFAVVWRERLLELNVLIGGRFVVESAWSEAVGSQQALREIAAERATVHEHGPELVQRLDRGGPRRRPFRFRPEAAHDLPPRVHAPSTFLCPVQQLLD